MAQTEGNQQVFDVAVLGGGPGGYPAAIKAAQYGKKVALIEADKLGGTCLNRGCIPSKALIASAEALANIRNAARLGINVGEISVDFPQMVAHKDQTVATVRLGLEQLIASNHIQLFRGFGKFISPRQLRVVGQNNALLYAEKIIIATGSEPRSLPAFPFDGKRILDSTALLDLKVLPKHIAIIGGGIIGCEFASLYAALGVQVTILEALERLLPQEDKGISTALAKAFLSKGIAIKAQAVVEKAIPHEQGITLHLAGEPPLEADIALVAVGRSLNTEGIGLEQAGIVPEPNGMIKVNKHMQTAVRGIYAIGDIASKWWLAHVASHQGIVAAKHACGLEAEMHYDAVPSVIFTEPEIGTVGLTLEAALARGYQATVGAFPFHALGKAQATLHTEGFAQVVTDKRTGQILGAQVVGHDASALLSEMAVAIANELTVESITETMHAHPTIAEAWLEAAFMASASPLHMPPSKPRFGK